MSLSGSDMSFESDMYMFQRDRPVNPHANVYNNPVSRLNKETNKHVTFGESYQMDSPNRYVMQGEDMPSSQRGPYTEQLNIRTLQEPRDRVRHSTPVRDMPREKPQYSQTSVRSAYPDYSLENYQDDTAREWVNQTDPRASGYVRGERQGRETYSDTCYVNMDPGSLNRDPMPSYASYDPYPSHVSEGPQSVIYPSQNSSRYDNNGYAANEAYCGNQKYPSNPTPVYPGGRSTSNSYYPQNMGRQNSWFDPRSSPYEVPGNHKAKPMTFCGTADPEWPEFIEHFENVATVNGWSESCRAHMLAAQLRGEALKFPGGLTTSQKDTYSVLKHYLSQRFNPQEREVSYRCEFCNRRRQKGENPDDYGYALRWLGQRAFPKVPYPMLVPQIIDQFIAGLGSIELQKHVQFHHPETLEAAINHAIEYTAVVGNLDKITKPSLTDEREVTAGVSKIDSQSCSTVSSLRPMEFKPSFSIQDLEQAVGQIVTKEFKDLAEKFISEVKHTTTDPDSEFRSRSPSQGGRIRRGNRREQTPSNFDRALKRKCTYCNKTNHDESRCFKKRNDLAAKQAQSLSE